MAKFSEDTLNSWRYPPSTTEETKLCNAESMIREAISDCDELKEKNIDIFGQGSYANDTNVKNNSDIDINVCLKDTVYVEIPTGKTYEQYGYSDSTYRFSDYKTTIYNALVKKFGSENVVRKDKCITIIGNSYRVEADVVPTFQYHRYDDNGSKHIGTKFITDKNDIIINYPQKHIENGKAKNANTLKRFKRLTRIFKRVRYKMIEDDILVSDNITSFLIECLVWNVPNHIFCNYNTWTDRLKQAIIYLYEQTKDESNCKNWGEVSELLYLFHSERKWNKENVNTFLVQMWNYLQF